MLTLNRSSRVPHARIHGQSLVEFALLLPLLLLILLGAVDLGRAFNAYIAVTNAAREGVRFGTANPKDSTSIKAHAIQEAVNGGVVIADSEIVIECAPYVGGTFSADYCPVPPYSGDRMRVTITHPFEFITLYLFRLPNIPISNFAIMAVVNGTPPVP